MAANRPVFAEQREDLAKTQAAARQKLNDDWKERTTEREQALQAVAQDRRSARKTVVDDADQEMLVLYRTQFEQSAEPRTNAIADDD